MPSPLTVNPHYGPCPKGRKGRPVVKMIDKGEKCVFDDTLFKDGGTYYILPCGHYFCGGCMRKMRNITTEGYLTEPARFGGFVVNALRCHCGRRYFDEDFADAKPFRALVRGQIIELTDDYVTVKEEPVEYA